MNHRMTLFVLFVLGLTLLMPQVCPAVQERPEKQFMSLTACIKTALENNPGLKEVSQEEAIQVEETTLARSAFLPRMDVLAGYTRFENPMRVIPAHENNEPGVFDRDLLETGIWLRLPLYQGGRYRAELSIAQLGRRQSVEIWKNTRQDLILNLHAVFYKILQLDAIQRSAIASMQALESHKKTTRLRLEVGRAAPVDGMKIDVRLAAIEQQLSAVKGDRMALLAHLAQFMGMDGTQDRPFDVRGRLVADTTVLPDLKAAREIAEKQRPELISARLDLEREEQEINVARSTMLPHVEGFGTYGLRSAVTYDEAHEGAWAAGFQATLPLYHGGAIRAKIRQAKIRKQQAQERLLAIRLQIRTDLEQALARLADSLERMEVNRKNITMSRETFRIEQAKNEDGKSSINDLLDAQSAMLLAEVAHSQSVIDYLLAGIQWRRGVGDPLWPLSVTEKGKQ